LIKEDFKIFLDSAPDAMVIINKNGEIEIANRQTENLFGYDLDELIGEKVEKLVPAEYRDKHIQHRTGFYDDIKTRPMGAGLDLYGARKDGSKFPVEISLSPVKMKDEVFVAAAIRDITERKKTEYALHALNRQLEESNKELESFSYSVSHDLRAPLRHIIGFSNKIMSTQFDKFDDNGKRIMKKITDAGSKLNSLIDELLKFTRIGNTELTRRKVNINNIVNEIITDLSQSETTQSIDWQIETLPEVYADPNQINHVLQNLLYNAVKYSSIRENPVIKVKHEILDDEHVFSVMDNGIGFNNEYKEKLFGMFNRLHNESQFEGTGIGLAIVKRIILKHGGRVWGEGELDKGASFYFTLPKNNV